MLKTLLIILLAVWIYFMRARAYHSYACKAVTVRHQRLPLAQVSRLFAGDNRGKGFVIRSVPPAAGHVLLLRKAYLATGPPWGKQKTREPNPSYPHVKGIMHKP